MSSSNDNTSKSNGFLVSNRSRHRVFKPSAKDDDVFSSQDDISSIRYATNPRYTSRSDDLENSRIRERLRALPTQKRHKGPVVARPTFSPAGASSTSSSPCSSVLSAAKGSEADDEVSVLSPSKRSTTSGVQSSDRRTPSPVRLDDNLDRKLDKAKRARFYLLQQPGPNSFLVGTEQGAARYRVMIGPQTCTCGRGPHCIHLLFIMLRVLKVNENEAMMTRKTLRNYEVETLFRNYQMRKRAKLKNSESGKTEGGDTKGAESQAERNSAAIEDEGMCAICLLEMRDGEILSRCNVACQNSFHKKCISVWFEECRSQSELLTCPLCRCVWDPPGGVSLDSSASDRGGATGTSDHKGSCRRRYRQSTASDPDYRSWVVSFSSAVADGLLTSVWDQRESALRQVAQLTVRGILEGRDLVSSPEACPRVRDAFRVVCRLLDDPVYNVFVAALRAFREILGYLMCETGEEQRCLQRMIAPVLRNLLRLCSDAQSRKAQLALSTLVELARGQNGELAVGREINRDCLGMGGVDHLISFVLQSSQFHPYHLWGRLSLLGRLLDQFEVSPNQLRPALTFAARHIHPASPLGVSGSVQTPRTVRQARRVFLSAARCLLQTPSTNGADVEMLLGGLDSTLQGRMRRKLGLEQQQVRGNAVGSVDNGRQSRPLPPPPPPERDMGSRPMSMIRSCVRLTPEPAYDSVAPSESGDDIRSRGTEETVSFLVEVMHESRSSTPLQEEQEVEEEEETVRRSVEELQEEATGALTTALKVQATRQNPLPIIPGLNTTLEHQGLGSSVFASSDCYVEGEDWVRGHLLGTGAFSHCFQARDQRTGTLMAVKQIGVARSTVTEAMEVLSAVRNEVELMSRLYHPNVARILGAVHSPSDGLVNVFVEWMPGGSVANLLARYGALAHPVVTTYTLQVLRGLAYLHDNHILHRDLKGANLLVNSTGTQVRISDFGASARLASHGSGGGQFQGQLLGTVAFMAPEVLRGEDYGRSCDIWSVGCVMIEMLTSKPPWNERHLSNHLALMFAIASSPEPPQFPDNVSPDIQEVLERCLEPQPAQRPTANDLLQHRIFATLVVRQEKVKGKET